MRHVTKDHCEEAFARYNECLCRLQQLEGQTSERLNSINEEYEAAARPLRQEKDECFEIMQAYAEANRQLFAEKKSLEFAHGILGFRTGKPQLKLLEGFKWDKVTELLRKKLPGYVRTVPEAAKDRLLADRHLPEVSKKLKSVGLEVVQEETFYVKARQLPVAS